MTAADQPTTERDERLREARERAAEVRAGRHVVPPTFERALLALDDAVARLDAVVTAVRDLADRLEAEAPKPQAGGFLAEEIRRALDGGAA